MGRQGNSLKQLRESKGIKAAFVASKLGISRSRMHNIENSEKAEPTTKQWLTLSEIYQVPVQELMQTSLEER